MLGCTPAPETPLFHSTDISGSGFGKHLTLADHNGRPRTLADFRGKVVLLFFGYTQCPDICPTAMERFAQTMKKLGPESDKVQVLFVTLDPERDTPPILAKYVPFFHPSFLGLTGTPAETDAVAKEFRVYYKRRQTAGELGYTLDHWAGAYAFDLEGRLRLYIPPNLNADDIAADVRRLLKS